MTDAVVDGGTPGIEPAPNANAPGEGGAPADWRTSISDENLRKSVSKYTSLDEFARAHNQLGGELKQRVRLPGKNATEEDLAKFRKAIGVPDTHADYVVNLPEDAEIDQDDLEFLDAFKPIAHKHGVPATAFSEFVEELAKLGLDKKNAVVKEIRSARKEAEEALAKEWGPEKDKHIQMATRAARMHGGDDFVELLNKTKIEGWGVLGDHPLMVKFLASIGAKSDEHDMLLASTVQEKQTAQARIDEIYNATPPGSAGYNNPAIQRELQELFKKVAGEHPVIGATR